MLPPVLQQLLVGVATNDVSDDAAHAGARLARALGAEVRLLHAVPVPDPIWLGVGRAEVERLHADAADASCGRVRARLLELERQVGLEPGELADKLECAPGVAHTLLLEHAIALEADAVVLGRHDERRFDFGRTARPLLHDLDAAIWLQAGPWRDVRRILVPVDFSRRTRGAVDTALGLGRAFGAEICLLHVFEPFRATYMEEVVDDVEWPKSADDAYRAQVREEFEVLAREVEWGDVLHTEQLAEGRPTQEILRLEPEYDLVVMASRGHTAPLLGHVAYSVLREATGAVLTLRDA